MLILALDTTLAACSAAIYDDRDERVLASIQEPMRQGHAERLAGMTREVADKAGINFKQIDRVAVTTGPGTFTGVRIGLSMAKGIGRALGIPVVGVSTLQAIAANVDDNQNQLPISVVMDARRDAVYLQTFSPRFEPTSQPQCIALADLGDHLPHEACIVIGSGSELISLKPAAWQFSQAPSLPDAGMVARLGRDLPSANGPPAPLYLRPADAKPQTALIKLARSSVAVTPVDASYCNVLANIHGECFSTGWSAEDLSQMLKMPGVSAFVASSEADRNEPAGFLVTRIAADEAEIITLCVRPSMRRRGIASQLLAPAIERTKAAGATKIFLEVRDDNIAAKALYTSAGFAQAGVRSGYYSLQDGSKADAVIMALKL